MTIKAQSTPAELYWNENGQPVSSLFDQAYFSGDSSPDENSHVFLEQHQLKQRWQALPENGRFNIVETGFGCVLNFLTSWQLWLQHAPASAHLHFVSCEKHPVTLTDLQRALALWPQLAHHSEQLINAYPDQLCNGFHRLSFGRVSLTLIIADASTALQQLQQTNHPLFSEYNRIADAVFLDGFSAETNPDMWSDELLQLIAAVSKPNATLSSSATQGTVSTSLENAGFTIEKTHTPSTNKLLAHFKAKQPQANVDDFQAGAFNSPYSAPWHIAKAPSNTAIEAHTNQTALIIGGGLAGCHSARALAERGFKVTIIERHSQLAQEGSGNPQGMLYAKLSPREESLPNFNLFSMMYAQRHYAPFWQSPPEYNAGQACGVLQLAHTEKEQKLHQKLRDKFGTGDLIEFVDANRASEIAGAEIELGGIYFPKAGWLAPQSVCRDLCNHANISVIREREVKTLKHQPDNTSNRLQWHAIDSANTTIATAEIAIIATASSAMALEQSQFFPLKPIRGQISYLPATSISCALKTVVCAEGYLSPAINNTHDNNTEGLPLFNGLGASFNLRDSNTELTVEDHQHNLDNLNNHTPKLGQMFGSLNASTLGGRVAFRCTTPDYLPLVGPVPIKDAFVDTFSLLRKNAKSSIPQNGPHYPNLYTSVGYGSRGLAYTPLMAEFLAAQICGEPLPLPSEYLQALHPGRFMIRNLIKNKI